MPERETEVFSNPIAPSEYTSTVHHEEDLDDSHNLTNEDFRKMLMTPRAPSGSGGSKIPTSSINKPVIEKVEEDEDDPAARRKKKKSYYAKLKRMEEERQKELADRYRDRARERREGQNKDYADTEVIRTTADYRAVAPDMKQGENYAERRKQVIQESKYLGGDMEHTHLVKGLDYALLEKVRAEINSKEKEEEVMMEEVLNKPAAEKEEEPEVQIQFKTKMGRSIYRTLFKSKLPERNELFLTGRMAYVVDLEDEFADSDVPCTNIRSKADCPGLDTSATLTTNDIIINKLTQILSYLRQGKRERQKLKKKEKEKQKEEEKAREKLPGADDGIYADVGEYMPSFSKSKDKKDRREHDRDHDRGKDRGREYRERDRDRRERDRDREREREYRDRDRERDRDRGRDRDNVREKDRKERDREKEKEKRSRKSYFEKPAEEEIEDKDKQANAKELIKNINDRFKSYADVEEEKQKTAEKQETDRRNKIKAKTEIDSYAECYPGMMESYDAIDDSDEEADYSKMDQGNKKGPVGRWDFDTQEEYSDYMSHKEALPKAAFQYGVKMADGRKTRRAIGPKDEKAELDRQWQKIQKIIDKRKPTDEGEGQKKMMKY